MGTHPIFESDFDCLTEKKRDRIEDGMVFYFTCQSRPDLAEKYIIYMGRDKFDNEALIQYGWPEDLWFHVDDLSSAHVYLRLPRGDSFETVPEEVVEECASLVKANSIKGCKMTDCKIVYTPWENLKKTNDIVKKIEKTRSADKTPDLQAERQERDRRVITEDKNKARLKAEEENKQKLENQKKKYEQSYDRLFEGEEMVANNSDNDSDDFM